MNKICTSIEQSKKLIELGLDKKTSDMYYWCGTDLRIGGHKAQDEKLDIPAWSLSALLYLMPYVKIRGNKRIGYSVYSKELTVFFERKCLLDVAFDMVVWLLENNYINVEKHCIECE